MQDFRPDISPFDKSKCQISYENPASSTFNIFPPYCLQGQPISSCQDSLVCNREEGGGVTFKAYGVLCVVLSLLQTCSRESGGGLGV